MSVGNYRTCLSGKAINSGTLNAFFEFNSNSGNVIYNSVHSVPAHYYAGTIIGSKNPAIVISSGNSLSEIVTGKFGGRDTAVIGDINNSPAFTLLLDYDINFCSISGNRSHILASSLLDATGISGFALGFNQSNRLFFEYFDSEKGVTGIHTLNAELKNKNTVFVATPDGQTIDLGFYDYEVDQYKGARFSIQGYTPSDKLFLGGLNRYSGVDHTGFIGNFNSVVYSTGYYSDPIKNQCVDCLFSTGVTFDNSTENYNVFRVTGFQFSRPNVSGVTGYSYIPVSVPHPTGGSTLIWRESGVVGVLRQEQVVTPLTGLSSSGEAISRSLNFNVDYSLKQEYGIKELSFSQPLSSGDLVEIYSYQKPQANFNISSSDFYLNKSGYANALLFQNGILNIQDLDYSISENHFLGDPIQGYDASDAFSYNLQNEGLIATIFSGLWSGSRIVLNQGSSGTGIDYFPNRSQYLESGTDILITGVSGTVVTGYDLFFNGQKLAENYDYERTYSGAVPLLKIYGTHLPYMTADVAYTGSFVAGYPSYPPSGISNIGNNLLVFSQKTTGVTVNRYVNYVTGSLSSVIITGYSEQVWINGVKQGPSLYDKTYPCSPSSGEFEYSPAPFLFYNNTDTYFNIE